MDPSQNSVPSPNVQPRAFTEASTNQMPLPPSAAVPVQGVPGMTLPTASALESAPPMTPPQMPVPQTPAAAVPGFLPPTVPVEPGPAPAAGPAAPAAASQPQTATPPSSADDGDLIEKEWVMKAKQIVEQTKTDPYVQTKELHALKSDYMKKRYNKTIGEAEE